MVKINCAKHTCEGCYLKKKKCSGVFPCTTCIGKKELCEVHQRNKSILPKNRSIVKFTTPVKEREIRIDYSLEFTKMQLKLNELEDKLKLAQNLKIQVFRVKPSVDNLIKSKV